MSRGSDPTLGFLLEAMQHINGFFEAGEIYGAKGVGKVVVDQFQNASNPAKRFRRMRMLSQLCLIELKSKCVLDLARKRGIVFAA